MFVLNKMIQFSAENIYVVYLHVGYKSFICKACDFFIFSEIDKYHFITLLCVYDTLNVLIIRYKLRTPFSNCNNIHSIYSSYPLEGDVIRVIKLNKIINIFFKLVKVR